MSIRLHIVCSCFPTTLTELISCERDYTVLYFYIYCLTLYQREKKIANSCLKVLVPASSGFPGGLVVKNPPANVRDASSVPWLGRSPGEGNGNSLQYSWLWNPVDRGAWQTTVHEVTKESDTNEWLNNKRSSLKGKLEIIRLISIHGAVKEHICNGRT